uniref:Replication region DNA-binding N-term n=1 Tax=Candidatus Kentrum sp. LFY TaxID=2126342 RepID=A0A450V920_9GAMM|nr:MAG: replication region DNA-binding N-term [Candidatus Kentron sp. LFY]
MSTGVTKKEIWQAAEALAQQEKIPTIMKIRSKLGGGSPHAIAFHLADWRDENLGGDDAIFYTDWEIEESKRKALEQEQIELMEEVDRLDAEIASAHGKASDGMEALDAERKAHKSMRSHSERWYEDLKQAKDAVEKLRTENRALQIEVAASREQRKRGEEFRVEIEKLRGELADLVAEKETKTSAAHKGVSRPKSAKTITRKPEPEKKADPANKPDFVKDPSPAKKTETREARKGFPPIFGVAQEIGQPSIKR